MKVAIDPKQRVVVTGLGVISPVGLNQAEFWASISAGISGIGPVESLDTTGYGSQLGAEVKGFDFEAWSACLTDFADRSAYFAVAAGQEALKDAGLSNRNSLDTNRFGVVLGTCMGGMRKGEEWHRQWRMLGTDRTDHSQLLGYQFYSPTDSVSAAFQLHGPKTTISTACAAGANAIGLAFDHIRNGQADYMLAGGTDTLANIAYAGFTSLQSLSAEPCQPYSKDRNGLTLGEGAGLLVLERLDLALARGANIYAEILGYGLSVDGYHPTAPHPQGVGAAHAIRATLLDSGLEPEQVQYVNGHGTGTPKNDIAETNAIKAALGETAYKIPISSTKSMIGHTLGAAGAIEGIATILAIYHQFVPPTANYQADDPEMGLDYVPNHGRPAALDVAISNSFAFGGNNAVVAYGRYTGQPRYKEQVVEQRVVITGLGMISTAGVGVEPFWEAVSKGQSCIRPITTYDTTDYYCKSGGEIPEFDARQFIAARDMRRMDTSSKYAIITSKIALADAGFAVTDANRHRVGVLAGTGSGPAQAAVDFFDPLIEGGPPAANPAIFPNTVFNAAAGQVAIHLQLQGCTSTITADRASSAHALAYSYDLLRRNLNDAIICVAMDEFHEAGLAGSTGLNLVSETPRPFDSQRNGYAPGGGAVALVLETLESAQKRGATIYGEVAGYGMSSDATQTGQQDIKGEHIARAMQLALAAGQLTPTDLNYIFASANGQRAGDLAEAQAIQLALGDDVSQVSVSSIKGTIGEPYGSTGAFNVVAGLLAMRDLRVPPTLGLEKPGAGCKLQHVTQEPMDIYLNNFLANSVACGGNNVSLLVKRFAE